VFAAVMMMAIGVLHVVAGLAAIVQDEFYVVGVQYAFRFDVTVWGWLHLLLGVVVAAAGYFVLSGAVWARTLGVVLAAFSLIANFVFIPYYPVWAVVIMALDVAVIWRRDGGRRGPGGDDDRRRGRREAGARGARPHPGPRSARGVGPARHVLTRRPPAPLPVGTHGEIPCCRVGTNRYRATTNHRYYDGVTRRIERIGRRASTAEDGRAPPGCTGTGSTTRSCPRSDGFGCGVTVSRWTGW